MTVTRYTLYAQEASRLRDVELSAEWDEAHLAWLVDCVNEYSIPTRSAAGELGKPLTPLVGGPRLSSAVTNELLTDVANSWFKVFNSAPDDEQIGASINELLDRVDLTVRATGKGLTLQTWTDDPIDALAAWGALTLAGVIGQIGADRLGVCVADRCVDVFVDRSPRHNRRYCSQLCQTRERVSRFRNRP